MLQVPPDLMGLASYRYFSGFEPVPWASPSHSTRQPGTCEDQPQAQHFGVCACMRTATMLRTKPTENSVVVVPGHVGF